MLVLDGVTRRFGKLTAVANVELAIEPGGFIGYGFSQSWAFT